MLAAQHQQPDARQLSRSCNMPPDISRQPQPGGCNEALVRKKRNKNGTAAANEGHLRHQAGNSVYNATVLSQMLIVVFTVFLSVPTTTTSSLFSEQQLLAAANGSLLILQPSQMQATYAKPQPLAQTLPEATQLQSRAQPTVNTHQPPQLASQQHKQYYHPQPTSRQQIEPRQLLVSELGSLERPSNLLRSLISGTVHRGHAALAQLPLALGQTRLSSNQPPFLSASEAAMQLSSSLPSPAQQHQSQPLPAVARLYNLLFPSGIRGAAASQTLLASQLGPPLEALHQSATSGRNLYSTLPADEALFEAALDTRQLRNNKTRAGTTLRLLSLSAPYESTSADPLQANAADELVSSSDSGGEGSADSSGSSQDDTEPESGRTASGGDLTGPSQDAVFVEQASLPDGYGSRKLKRKQKMLDKWAKMLNESTNAIYQLPQVQGADSSNADIDEQQQHSSDEQETFVVKVEQQQPTKNGSTTSQMVLEFDEDNQLIVNHAPQASSLPNSSRSGDESLFIDGSQAMPQLPAKYDAIVQTPPEGYYDDYYKPHYHLTNESQQSNYNRQHMDQRKEEDATLNEIYYDTLEATTGSSNITTNDSLAQPPTVLPFLVTNHTNNDDLRLSLIARHQPAANESSFQQQLAAGNFSLNHFYENQQSFIKSGADPNTHEHIIEYVEPAAKNGSKSDQSSDNHSSPSNGPRHVNQREANVQLIMANSNKYNQNTGNNNNNNNNNSNNDQIDDKAAITYVSEGSKLVRSRKDSPRNTFVNKDMNEYPSLEQNGSSSSGGGGYDTNHTNNSSTNFDRTQGERQSADSQQQPPQEAKKEFNSDSTSGNDSSDQSSSSGSNDFNQEDSASADEGDDSRRPLSQENYEIERNRDFYEPPQFDRKSQSQREARKRTTTIAGVQQSQQAGAPAKYRTGEQDSDATEEQPGIRNSSSKRRQPTAGAGELKRSDSGRSERRRPRLQPLAPDKRRHQLREAKFAVNDLVLAPPTRAPNGALEAFTRIPKKVAKLREAAPQPDKHELMNELLTALDRVKAAIYKLQPLTAKMNAIYRKSVSANTRDIIMDAHKGTYAKRYPPGDYDNSYDKMQPGESTTNSIYVRAPRDLLKQMHANSTGSGSATFANSSAALPLPTAAIVATGIGRRLDDGRVEGQLQITNKAMEQQAELNPFSRQLVVRASELSNELASVGGGDDHDASRLFGYRITIFPSSSANEDGAEASDDDDVDVNEEDDVAAGNRPLTRRQDVTDEESDSGDLMATSESSISLALAEPLVGASSNGHDDSGDDDDDDDDDRNNESTASNQRVDRNEPDASHKITKSVKKEEEEKKGNQKKRHKMQEAKKKKKSGEKKEEKQSKTKKKKGEEETKKKKEFKKVKHKKQVVSNEKKALHRDKRIKAHDRGAAKEKALKERTQIEFFEREQIVDDEYEKGKKSTLKANSMTGAEKKKTHDKLGGGHSGGDLAAAATGAMVGDSIAAGSGRYAHHEPMEARESSTGKSIGKEEAHVKKTNKYEKKKKEAKGKKFKGWREKGYKIITETEFIDRGSLHDSAYKKRDKGGSLHHKEKKFHSLSEGQQGSAMEAKKKKKTEKEAKKDSKMSQKKDSKMTSEKKDKKKTAKSEEEKKKSKKSKKEKEHDAAASDLVTDNNQALLSTLLPEGSQIKANNSFIIPAAGSYISTVTTGSSGINNKQQQLNLKAFQRSLKKEDVARSGIVDLNQLQLEPSYPAAHKLSMITAQTSPPATPSLTTLLKPFLSDNNYVSKQKRRHLNREMIRPVPIQTSGSDQIFFSRASFEPQEPQLVDSSSPSSSFFIKDSQRNQPDDRNERSFGQSFVSLPLASNIQPAI